MILKIAISNFFNPLTIKGTKDKVAVSMGSDVRWAYDDDDLRSPDLLDPLRRVSDENKRAEDLLSLVYTRTPGNEEKVLELIKRGVKYLKNSDGWTAVHIAASNGNIVLLKAMLDNGAPIDDLTSQGQQPIHCAVMSGRRQAFKILMRHGADINAIDINKKTPLHYATQLGTGDMLRYILRLGAKTDLKDSINCTPQETVDRLRKTAAEDNGARATFQRMFDQFNHYAGRAERIATARKASLLKACRDVAIVKRPVKVQQRIKIARI